MWPIVVGYLAQWPMILLSLHLAGSVWPAIVVCYGIPMLINGFRTRLYGVVMTVVGIVALHALVVALAVTVQVSLWILMALCIASPLIGFLSQQALANSPMRTSKNGWCVTASCKMCQFCIKETGLLNDGCYGLASAAALTRSDFALSYSKIGCGSAKHCQASLNVFHSPCTIFE
ncbi:MAG: hypothetical protein L6U61_06965 [Bacteroidales bacterium]|nr:MAG: hypothetical protein L6U61_06965 [Bacteroidales bacterium]